MINKLLQESTSNTGSNTKNAPTAKFLLLHKFKHHVKNGGKHIKKHHKKIIGFTTITSIFHFLLIKGLGVHLLGIKALALMLTFFGISHNINISADFNTQLFNHISINTIEYGEKSIVFENEYKTTPLIIKSLSTNKQNKTMGSCISNKSTTGFSIIVPEKEDDSFLTPENKINYIVFDLDEIKKHDGIAGGIVNTSGNYQSIVFGNEYSKTPTIMTYLQSGGNQYSEIYVENISTTGATLFLSGVENGSLLGYLVLENEKVSNIFESNKIDKNEFLGSITFEKEYINPIILSNAEKNTIIESIRATGFNYSMVGNAQNDINRFVFEGQQEKNILNETGLIQNNINDLNEDNNLELSEYTNLLQEAEKINEEKEIVKNQETTETKDPKENFTERLKENGFQEKEIGNKKIMIGEKNINLEDIAGKIEQNTILENIEKNSKTEVFLAEETVIKDQEGEIYLGEFKKPEKIEIENTDLGIKILDIIKIGADEKIFLQDENGDKKYASIRTTTSGLINEEVLIYYSNDNSTRKYLTTVNPTISGDTSIIKFQTDHFTTFLMGTWTGNFTINNDTAYTTGLSVILTSSVSGATHMRFGNSIAERNAASRVAYNANYSRTLTGAGGDGIKRVYAQFSGNGIIRNVSDSIIYDTSEASMNNGLLTHLDGSYVGTTFYDLSSFGYNFTSSAAGMNGTWGGIEQIMLFNGSREITRNTTPTISATPFTISAWVRPDRVTGLQGIVFRGRNNAATRHYGINLNGTNFQITARNTTNRTANGTITAEAGQRYHVVGVFNSNTSRTIYVNGVQGGTSTNSVTFDTTSQQRTVGKYPGTATNRLSGAVDEVRVYNKSLSASEILGLYMTPPTFDTQTAFTGTPTLYGELPPKIAQVNVVINGMTLATTSIGAGTGKRKTLPYTTGLANGTYNVILNYTNVYGRTGTTTHTNALTINTTGMHIIYSPATPTSGNVIATLTGLDPTYMIVNNFGSEFTTFTNNGNFVWQYVDKQGTTGTTTANVTWIDREAPSIIGVESGATYTGEIIINFADNVLFSGAVISGINIEYHAENIQSGTIELSEGTYQMTAYDAAGNATFVTFTIVPNLRQKIGKGFIDKGYKTGVQTLLPVNSDVFIGSGDIDLDLFEGELLYPMVIQSVDTINGLLAEVEFPEGVKVKDVNGNKKTGMLHAPRFKDPQIYQNNLGKLGISAIDVGGDQSMKFKNSSGNAEYVTFRMPVPGKQIGELIDIYFSEDNGSTFKSGPTVPVREINGNPYVVFISDHFTVAITVANNGTNISADNAINSIYSGSRTTLSNITIAEGANNDFAIGTNVTLILTAPTNRQFNPGVGGGAYTPRRNITAVSLSVTTTAITLTLTIDKTNRLDSITLSGIQVKPIDGKLLPSLGNIMRLSSNPGTMSIVGVTNNLTNFGTLSQIPGIPRNLLMTLSGQTFQASTGNIGLPANQIAGEQFVIPKITAIDQYTNIATSYSGTKTLSYTGATVTVDYTTGVLFTSGQSTTTLNTTIYQAQAGIRLTATDGVITGLESDLFNVILPPVAELLYSGTTFYENSISNNGIFDNEIIITLSGGAFSPYIISSGYIEIENMPAGLTGYYVLSGTDVLIMSLTGQATNHCYTDSTGMYLTFLSGAFVDIVPEEVIDAIYKYLYVQFYYGPECILGQQLILKGTFTGGQFYDHSPLHRTTTNYGAVATTRNSIEPIMYFDGNNRYIDVGNYSLTEYTVSARFYASTVDNTRRSIIGDTAGNRELSLNTSNQLEAYNNGQLASTMTIVPNRWYHAVITTNSSGTRMYINGVLHTSNTSTTAMSNVNLLVGHSTAYGQPRSGYIDEVYIFDNAVTAEQVAFMYMRTPSYTPRTTYVASPNIKGTISDPNMSIWVTVSGVQYEAINDGGMRRVLGAGPFASGTYDVQIDYMNVYGRTGMVYYTGGLTVIPQIYIDYNPDTLTSGDVVATMTGYGNNITITNNGGSPNYTFTGNGQFVFFFQDEYGHEDCATATVDRIQKASITYSNDTFYENQILNNGSIVNTIVATITGDTFASNIVTNHLVTLENVPMGLSEYFILSGNSQLIIGLTGNAISHTSGASISGLNIVFLDGAFTTYPPSGVGGSYQTGISVEFYDGALIGGQQLRLKGGRSGTQFFDSSPNGRLTTGFNSIGNSLWSTETVMGPFNGTNQYIDIGNYTLTNYTVSIWLHSTNNDANRRSAIGSNSTTVSELEIVKNTTNFLEFYGHGRLTSTFAIQSGVWYHVVLKQTSTGTQMFIDGVLNNSNANRVELSADPLAVGADRAYGDRWQGYLDEAQIFDSPLTDQQIDELYMKRPSYTGKTVYTSTPTVTGTMPDPLMRSWVTISGVTYTGINNQDGTRTVNDIGPLSSGTYDVQLDYMNVYGKTGTALYTGGLIVDLTVTGTIEIGTPIGFTFGGIIKSQPYTQEFTGQFETGQYFFVDDQIGLDNGRYTTISATKLSGSLDSIENNDLFIKSNELEKLEGDNNSLVEINNTLNDYTPLSGQINYIFRNFASNNGKKGKYGDRPYLKVNIPSLKPADNYHGQLIFTIYEN